MIEEFNNCYIYEKDDRNRRFYCIEFKKRVNCKEANIRE